MFSFDAGDVFTIAEQMERDVSEFYRYSASVCRDAGTTRVLSELASMENEHGHVFSSMRSQFASSVPAIHSASGNLPSFVDDALVEGLREDLANRFSGRETPDQLLRKAIDLEKSMIAFFLRIQDAVEIPAGKKKIDALLREEFGHILTLSGAMASMHKRIATTGGEA
jgi:rubrerythrin